MSLTIEKKDYIVLLDKKSKGELLFLGLIEEADSKEEALEIFLENNKHHDVFNECEKTDNVLLFPINDENHKELVNEVSNLLIPILEQATDEDSKSILEKLNSLR